jgi:hypothetical protein
MTTDLARTDAPQTALANPEDAAAAITHYLGTGDLSRLPAEQRAALYLDTCASLNLNPRTRPFDWIEFYDPETKGKKLTLYPNRSCAEQIRRQHQISVRIVSEDIVGKLFKVVAEGRKPNGVTDTATAYVPLTDKDGNALVGQRLANAFMKGQTVAKRRLTFSMVGMFAPPEMDELRQARIVVVDGTGRVLEHPTQEQKALAENPAMARAIGELVYEDAEGQEAPLAGMPDQRVTQADVTPPRPAQGPPASFKNSDEQIAEWRRTWFATVKRLSLDTDAARAAFVRQWTADEWPKAKRTDSLATFFARATPAEAEDFLGHVRALMDDERRELLAQSYEDMPDQQPSRPDVDRRVHDAVQLTGGPAGADDDDDQAETAF